MMSMGDLAAWCSLLGALVALVFAGVIWRADRRGRRNRQLALLLLAEAAFQGTIILSFWGTDPYVEIFSQWISLSLLSAAFLLFCTTLEGRLARALAHPAARAAIVAVCGSVLVASLWSGSRLMRAGETAEALESAIGWPWPLFAVASIVSLVVSINAYASTAPGSALRRKARAFALAFGLRDALYAGVVLWWAFASFTLGSPAAAEASSVVGGLTTIVFVGLLTYGILSTQLFDIDLRIKWGIRSGTLASILVGGFFAAYKLAEFYLGREVGWTVGAVFSGLFFFLAPRLNKFADGVANAAMPKVQPTSDYISYKKLEVYRAAVESALEGDRGIHESERAMLDRLRARLGVSEADAKALEAELLAPA